MNPRPQTPDIARPFTTAYAVRPIAGARLRLDLAFIFAALLMLATLLAPAAQAQDNGEIRYKRIPTQYIAALADPDANSGGGAQNWGLWTVDPGPRGVRLKHYEHLKAAGGIAPAQWTFNDQDWWLEEYGKIMEPPQFPMPPGKYIVTGNRKVMTVLTVYPTDDSGDSRWELDHGASIYDVTHLRCRSARYTPATPDATCSPGKVQRANFPVAPGEPMPEVEGCIKQDYSVLLVIGVAEQS